MPNSTQAVMMPRKFSTPARCPARRGSPRAMAQRPLPSMIRATWTGTFVRTVSVLSEGILDFHDLGFFALAELVHFLDVLVRQLLQVNLAAFQLVLGDHLFLLELAQVLVHRTADVAHGHARVLQPVVHHLGELPAALLVQGRDAEADDLAVVVGG